MVRHFAAAMLVLTACDEAKGPPPAVTLKEFVKPAPVAAVPVAPVDAGQPHNSVRPDGVVAALVEATKNHGCIPNDTWWEFERHALDADSVKGVVDLLRDGGRPESDRERLHSLLARQTDEVALAYWRDVLKAERSPIADQAVTALMAHGSADDVKLLTGKLGQSEPFDLTYLAAIRSRSEPRPPEVSAAVHAAFDDHARPISVRASALETLAALSPPPVAELRGAVMEPELRAVSLRNFNVWFAPADLALLDSAAAADPAIADALDSAASSWFATYLGDASAAAVAQARLEALHDQKMPAPFPRLLLVLGLWAASRGSAALSIEAHSRGAAVAPAKSGLRLANQACRAALEGGGLVAAPNAEIWSYARFTLSGIEGFASQTEKCAEMIGPGPATRKRAKVSATR